MMSSRRRKGKLSGDTLRLMWLGRPALIPLLAASILLVGCGSNAPPQASTSKTQANNPNHTAASEQERNLKSIRTIVAKQLGLNAGEIDDAAPLSKQRIAADELDAVEIIMIVEDTFGIKIKDEEVSDPQGQMKDDLSVRKLAAIVLMKKGGK